MLRLVTSLLHGLSQVIQQAVRKAALWVCGQPNGAIATPIFRTVGPELGAIRQRRLEVRAWRAPHTAQQNSLRTAGQLRLDAKDYIRILFSTDAFHRRQCVKTLCQALSNEAIIRKLIDGLDPRLPNGR